MTTPELMATSTVADDRPPEPVATIPDHLMVFRSDEAPLPLCSEKKKVTRLRKSKLKLRKSTPAPAAKGNGRKRFTISPAPEDKQLRKKLDFGEEGDGLAGDGPRCKVDLLPATRLLEPEVPSSGESVNDNPIRDLVPYNPAPSGEQVPRPTSGEVAGELVLPEEPPTVMCQPLADVASLTNSNMELVADFVSFPNVEHETKMLLESGELTCHMGESQVCQTIAILLEEKLDNLVSIANSDVADELDMLAAQPLIAGGQLAGDQSITVPSHSAPDSRTAETPSDTRIPHDRDSPVYPTPSCTNIGPCANGVVAIKAGLGVGVWHPPASAAAQLFVGPGELIGPSLEEFPPLAKGRTLKMRDRYEAGTVSQFVGSGLVSRGLNRGVGSHRVWHDLDA